MRRSLALAVIVLLALPLTGCVVEEINEGIAASNQNVQRTNQDLEVVTRRMAEIDSQLAAINTELSAVSSELTEINTQLAVLVSINDSLKKLDVHLASLRETIKRIPFLRLSPDDEETDEQSDTTPQSDEPPSEETPEPNQSNPRR